MYKQPSGAQHRRRQRERIVQELSQASMTSPGRTKRRPGLYNAEGLLVLLVDAVIAYLYNTQTGQERLRLALDSCETFLEPQLMDHLPWDPDRPAGDGLAGTRGLLVLGGEGK